MSYYNNSSQRFIPGITNTQVARKIKMTIPGKLFIGILLVVIFEGAFRKWISASLTNPLVFFRDAMALYGIFWAIKRKRLNFTQTGTQILWLWTALLLLWGLLQLLVNQSSPLIFIVGMRFWLLYLWFAYAAAISMTEHDFNSIIKIILTLLLLLTPLTVMQHLLPPSSFLNKQVGGDAGNVFLVADGVVRTTSTFSFTAGNTTFLAFASPFALAMLTSNRKLWKSKWMPKICFLALGIGTMVSGSRGSFVSFLILFIIYLIFSVMYSKSSKKVSTIVILIISTAMLASIPFIFTRAVEATQDRIELAADSEDVTGRVLSTFSFGNTSINLIGYGFGAGTNFAGISNETRFSLGEGEMQRTALEGGIPGLLFIFLKFFIALAGVLKSISIAKSTGNSLPFMLWITIILVFFTWPIMLQLTINTLGFLLLSLAITSLKLNKKY